MNFVHGVSPFCIRLKRFFIVFVIIFWAITNLGAIIQKLVVGVIPARNPESLLLYYITVHPTPCFLNKIQTVCAGHIIKSNEKNYPRKIKQASEYNSAPGITSKFHKNKVPL
jgi:hypothetical protein